MNSSNLKWIKDNNPISKELLSHIGRLEIRKPTANTILALRVIKDHKSLRYSNTESDKEGNDAQKFDYVCRFGNYFLIN